MSDDGPLIALKLGNTDCTAYMMPGIEALRDYYKNCISGPCTCPNCGGCGDMIVNTHDQERGLKIFMLEPVCPDCLHRFKFEVVLGEHGWSRLSRQQIDKLLRRASVLRGGII